MVDLPVPSAGLRRPGVRLSNKSNDVAKVAIVVAAGAELEVDDDVAKQLVAQSRAFVKIDDGASGGVAVVAGASEGAPPATSDAPPKPKPKAAKG